MAVERKAGKSREDIIRESMLSPKVIDTTINFSIPRSREQYDPKKHKYKCYCCGKGYNAQQKTNFQRSNSPLFQANDGFLPWCKECTDKYFSLLVALYSGNEEHAIEHFCIQADWVYDIEALKSAREISADRSRISHYAAKKNLNVGDRKTYIDTVKHNYEIKQDEIITSREQTKAETSTITASAVDRWGVGFTEADYKNLDEHYRMLKKNNPNCDNNQEIFIKSLCNLNMLMIKALKNGDSDKYVKLTEQYSKTFRQAGLVTVPISDTSTEETLGVTLATIAQYTPEEYYKNKKLYKDFDGLGDYIKRFITRPLRNLQHGTTDRDPEYSISNEDDDDE